MKGRTGVQLMSSVDEVADQIEDQYRSVLSDIVDNLKNGKCVVGRCNSDNTSAYCSNRVYKVYHYFCRGCRGSRGSIPKGQENPRASRELESTRSTKDR